MYTNYYYFCYAIAQHYSMVLWLGLAICKMLHYIIFMPLLAPMFAVCWFGGLSISMLSGENFQS